ncbi:MAG: hypothetical protein ACOYNL_06450 [Rickettsiales bacterium]
MSTELTTEQNPPKASWIQRQAGGMAIGTAIGAVGGAVWHGIKKRPLMGGIKGGSIAGFVATLGFGGMVYDSVFGAKDDPAKKSFTDIISEERARDKSATPQL